MPSETECQEAYLKARNALNNIARSLRATDAQRQEARAARTKLTLDFIGKNVEDVEVRSQQFREFIDAMEDAIEQIGRDSPIDALETLKTILSDAEERTRDEASNT
jgi:hypothetical protein